jgi:LysR family cyn operon transcriptional activator
MLLEHLRSFHAVAKHLGLRDACLELHLTQPAISKRLKSLEKELGIKLYLRTGKGIELTEAGRSFLKKVEPILKQIGELKETFNGKIPQEKQTKVLYIAAAFSMAANLLPSIIRRFERLHANLQVDCQTGSSQQIQQLILEGRAEIGVSTYRSLNADIVSEPFRVQTLVFFVKRRHALAKRRRITLKDVLAYPLVTRAMMGAPTWAQDVLKELSDRGYKPKIALQCNGPLQVKEAVARNIGVGLSYLDNIKEEASSGRFVVLKGADFQFNTLSYIQFSRKRELSPMAHEFLGLLRQAREVPVGRKLDELGVLMKRSESNLVAKNRKLA